MWRGDCSVKGGGGEWDPPELRFVVSRKTQDKRDESCHVTSYEGFDFVLFFCVFHFCGIDERRVGIIGAIQPACPSLTPCVFYVWMLKNSEKIIERFYINLLF